MGRATQYRPVWGKQGIEDTMSNEVMPGYRENFEDALKGANLQGQTCQVILATGSLPIGRVIEIDSNCLLLEHENQVLSYIRPQAILAILRPKQGVPICPWCKK